jgi:hypothetical protein
MADFIHSISLDTQLRIALPLHRLHLGLTKANIISRCRTCQIEQLLAVNINIMIYCFWVGTLRQVDTLRYSSNKSTPLPLRATRK